MGLKDILTTQGSKFTYPANGDIPQPYAIDFVPLINKLATNNSTLHYDYKLETFGYSTKGTNFAGTNQSYISYKDGDDTNILPSPSTLDWISVPSQYITKNFK